MTDMVIPPERAIAVLHRERHHFVACEEAESCVAWREAARDVEALRADAVFTEAADIKALVETATRLGRELGRREALKEVADEMSEALDWRWGDDPRESYVIVQIDRDTYRQLLAAREIATKEPK